MIKVAVDAMGGDFAPLESVKGAVSAVNKEPETIVYLVGDKTKIQDILKDFRYDKNRIVVVHASETIDMNDIPTVAIKTKKDSSIVVAMKLVKSGEADAFVSAGNTGAILVGAQTVIGRNEGVVRAPLAFFLPTVKGVCLLLDCGANVDPKPEYLLTFAKLGTEYYEKQFAKKKPTVALVNIGVEEEKGNALVKSSKPLFEECKDINYIGSIEARDIPYGGADIVVCDAFTGNVILKLCEGLAGALVGKIKEALMSSLTSKIGAILIKKPLKNTLKSLSSEEYGGAVMLGLKGLVIKTHGNSKSIEICNSILQCVNYKKEGR